MIVEYSSYVGTLIFWGSWARRYVSGGVCGLESVGDNCGMRFYVFNSIIIPTVNLACPVTGEKTKPLLTRIRFRFPPNGYRRSILTLNIRDGTKQCSILRFDQNDE